MSVDGHVERNVQEIAKVESRDRARMDRSERLAEVMTAFCGSMGFVWLHATWFAVWILVNQLGFASFDDFPYGLLTMIVSLEAIFLSTFVLISENRQSQQADKRAKVEFQVNLLAEQEITKLLEMVVGIREHLGIHDPEDDAVERMKKRTDVEDLANAVEAADDSSDIAPTLR